MIDYQEIINNLTEDRIKDILNQLKIPFEDKGAYLLMPTYCHNHFSEEASHKLYYYKNNKIFMCYTECGSMSIFSFLKHFYEAQQIEYDWYKDIYSLILGQNNQINGLSVPKYKSLKDKYKISRKTKTLPIYDEKCLEVFTKIYPVEWLKEGISKAAMDKFNILYSISQNKIIIPHYDVNNNLIGIRGRALNEWEVENIGKYMPVQIEQKWYSHPLSMNLYGLNFNKENIRQEKVCYLLEGEKSVLKCEDFSFPNCSVAVCGSNFNKYALNILLDTCSPTEIIICFDKEEIKGSTKYFDKLYSLGEKYKNYCNFSFIYDRHNLLELKDSPVDKGEEVFKKLVKERTKII